MSNSNERPVVVELASGARYGLPSIAEAQRIYPNGKIVSYQDGTMIDPANLEEAGLTDQGDVEVTEKMTRDQLEAIATDLGIEGADNKSAFATKGDLVAKILEVKAELQPKDPEPLKANPEFRDHSREELEAFASEWYEIDPAGYEADEDLRLALVEAYDAETGTGESE